MVETVTFDFNARPLGSAPVQTSTMETPEADISAIQSGRIQPLPTYSEHDDSLSRLLLSTVDPNDTRHIPPSYMEEITPVHTGNEVLPLLPDSKTEISKSIEQDRLTTHSTSTEPFLTVDHLSSTEADVETNQDQEDTDAAYAKLLQEEEAAKERQNVIKGFFTGIKNEQGDVVELFISRGLVTANTVDEDGQTPLLAAVRTKNVKIVQQLLDAGAEADAFGVIDRKFDRYTHTFADNRYILTERTPLMLAASLGHLPLVKLFMERYGCSDAKIAPDGQIALRLASSGGHREVVDYLPSRRGGGFLRWKTAHQKSLGRIRRAVNSIYEFIKFFVWRLPKFFLWTCPKHMLVLPVVKGCKYCWENKGRFKNYCVSEIKKIPERTSRAAKACGRGIKKIPGLVGDASKAVWRGVKKIPAATVKVAKWTKEAIVEAAKGVWHFITVDVPGISKMITKELFQLLFVHIPQATTVAAKWAWAGLVGITSSIWNIVTRILSIIHTFLTSLSLRDILNGIKSILEAIFVTFPKMLLKWIESFGDMSWKVLKGLFGCVGMAIWYLVRGIIWLVDYIPRQIGVICLAIGASIAKGLHEILVWFSPKA